MRVPGRRGDRGVAPGFRERSRFELDVSPRDFLAFAVGYDGSIDDLRLHTPAGLVTRDWICVEVEDLAAQGAINYLFASGAAGHALTFHAASGSVVPVRCSLSTPKQTPKQHTTFNEVLW
jgi:hypothetical protein